MKKIFVALLSLGVLFATNGAQASVSWNTASNDCRGLAVVNQTTNVGYSDPCWPNSSVSAEPGQSINVRLYYHNTGDQAATNVRLVLNASTINNSSSSHSFTGQIVSDQGGVSLGSVSVNLSSAQKLSFGSARWYPNQTKTSTTFLNGQDGSEVIGGGLNIGTIQPGWATQGSVVVAFYVNNPSPTGQITASSSSCQVQAGQNSCPIPFTWKTENPATGVTSNVTNNNGQVVATGNSDNQSFNITVGSSTYRLNHNNSILDSETVSASCASGSTLNSNTGYCEQVKPTGNISASYPSCQIEAGKGSCTIPFSWSTNNPVGTSAVTKDGGSTVATSNSGSNVPFSVSYGSSTFRLYNNSLELDNETVSASCATGTNWDSATSTCKAVVYDCKIISFTANQTMTSPGEAVSLSWSTENCNSVNISGVASNLSPNGTRTVWPSNTTTYVLTGYGDTSVTPSRSVQVTIGGPVGAPTFPAGAPTFGA